MPFPIGALLEPSLYLYSPTFFEIFRPTHVNEITNERNQQTRRIAIAPGGDNKRNWFILFGSSLY